LKLQDKIAIVTGGGRGIGRAIALALAAEGAKVAVNYSRSAEAAEQVVAQITGAGGEAFAVQANVADSAQVEAMIAATKERFGRVDILVNNAGVTRDTLLMRMKEEDWDTVLDTNLKGAFLCAKAVAPMLLKQKGGVIVNLASVGGLMGFALTSAFAASKGGVIALTRTAAIECAPHNIRVNCGSPSPGR
jgi:3-oxoacyl-[acyl-carrier protein] reductase